MQEDAVLYVCSDRAMAPLSSLEIKNVHSHKLGESFDFNFSFASSTKDNLSHVSHNAVSKNSVQN